jgi:fructoselysine-6-P-deglycase FrlB-like protein
MAGETRRAVLAQPEWLRQVPTSKELPAGARVVFTGCGTSFHAAQTGGWAVDALEAVLKPPLADIMVCVSHEGGTPLTMESELAERADEVIVATPQIERSWCHTASYTCAVAALDALNGEEIGWLPDAVEEALLQDVQPFEQERVIIAGAGRDWPTAQEAALKLREGAWVDASAYQTEELMHGHLAAVDEHVRAFVLEGERRAGERALDAIVQLEKLGCEATLVPTHHPVVDIVRFQLLTLAVAGARGIDPDPIRRTPGSKWAESAGEPYPNA